MEGNLGGISEGSGWISGSLTNDLFLLFVAMAKLEMLDSIDGDRAQGSLNAAVKNAALQNAREIFLPSYVVEMVLGKIKRGVDILNQQQMSNLINTFECQHRDHQL